MKKLTHYLFEVENWYIPHNSLHKELHKLFWENNYLLIKADQLEEFKNFISKTVDEISEKNKRCTPVTIRFESPNDKGKIRIYGFEQMSIWIKPCFTASKLSNYKTS